MTSDNDAPQDSTKHDGDPIFEALVYGWTCSDNEWNGASDLAGELGSERAAALSIRTRLAGYFEQYLEQRPDPDVGDRVMHRTATGRWKHGDVIEIDGVVTRVRWDGESDLENFDHYRDHQRLLISEPRPAAGR